jgi:hypothetical protein
MGVYTTRGAKVGRLVLVMLVLTVIPLHQQEMLGLYKKTLKQVEKILQGFL